MRDEWRVTVDFHEEGQGRQLVEWLAALELEGEERERLGERIIVSRDGPRVYLYADSEDVGHAALERVQAALADRDERARLAFERWHPVEQVWLDASQPLPRTAAEELQEHRRRQEREAAHSLAAGHAEWEVRVELRTSEDTELLAERLRSEGVPVLRRHTFLLAGAVNEDDATALAERLRAEAPAGARIVVQPGGGMAWEVTPRNPFAVFGGLGT